MPALPRYLGRRALVVGARGGEIQWERLRSRIVEEARSPRQRQHELSGVDEAHHAQRDEVLLGEYRGVSATGTARRLMPEYA
jgi:hypothetical protein